LVATADGDRGIEELVDDDDKGITCNAADDDAEPGDCSAGEHDEELEGNTDDTADDVDEDEDERDFSADETADEDDGERGAGEAVDAAADEGEDTGALAAGEHVNHARSNADDAAVDLEGISLPIADGEDTGTKAWLDRAGLSRGVRGGDVASDSDSCMFRSTSASSLSEEFFSLSEELDARKRRFENAASCSAHAYMAIIIWASFD
jgi:hypothetical protein